MKKKTIALLLVLMMVFGITCGGTIAYLTSKTEAVVNTFTVGNVQIKLDEAEIGADGIATGKRISGAPNGEEGAKFTNTYKLIPGGKYAKDPTVTVLGGSEESYIRMLVTVSYDSEADAVLAKHGYQGWFDFNQKWGTGTIVDTNETQDETTRVYEFRYTEKVAALSDGDDEGTAPDDVVLPALFETITIPEGMTNDELALLDSLSISVEAHAIQTAGFDDADAAWAEFQ